MPEMVLIGGPWDGAEGPSPGAGIPVIWVRTGNSFHRGGKNGLLFTHHPGYGGARYVLTSRADEGRFIYSYGEGSGSLEYLSREEALAA